MKLLSGPWGHRQVPQPLPPPQGLMAVLKASPGMMQGPAAVPAMSCHRDACAWPCPISTLALPGITSDLPIAAGLFGQPWAAADPGHHPCPLSGLLAGCCGMTLCWEGPSPLAPGLVALPPQLLPYTYLRFPKHIHNCARCKVTIHIK